MKNIFRLSIPTLLIFLIVILSQGCKKTSSTNGRTPMGTWVLNGMESDELDSEIYYSNQPPTYTTYWVTSDVSNLAMVIAGSHRIWQRTQLRQYIVAVMIQYRIIRQDLTAIFIVWMTQGLERGLALQ